MLTAKDLLYKASDYDGFWNTSKKMKASKPSQCRLYASHMKYGFNQKTMRDFSTEDDYVLHLKKKFLESMQNSFAEIDGLLCLLIDPEKRTFTEEETGYADYNFTVLDAAWQSAMRTQL